MVLLESPQHTKGVFYAGDFITFSIGERAEYRTFRDLRSVPDFKHKKTQDTLWLEDRRSPHGVKAKLASIAPGTCIIGELFVE